MNAKPHLSPSQLSMLSRCGEQYRRRYIEREIIPPGVAAMKGKGLHKGAETNMRQKIESHVDLPATDIVEAAVAGFETETRGGYMLTPEEFNRGAGIVLGEAKDSLVTMAQFHAQHQAPDYQPILVEKSVRIELSQSSHDLLGVIDLADDKDRVADFKTAGKSKSQSEADSSIQLTTYAAAFHAETGRIPSELRLDTVVQTKTKTYRSLVSTQRGTEDFSALAARINAATRAIQAGIFIPANPESWWCSGKFCGYFSTCPFVNRERGNHAED